MNNKGTGGNEHNNSEKENNLNTISEDDKNAVNEKLIKLEEYLQELKDYKPDSFKNYISHKKVKYSVERLLQLIIDLALDINNIIIKSQGGYPASDYFNSFIDLVEFDVFNDEFAQKIAPSTGIRNRLVHEYEKINDKIVYNSIDKTINYYTKYMKNIIKYLAKVSDISNNINNKKG